MWTEGQIKELKRMWLEGIPASKISEKLAAFSRNAVIGKAYRLGLIRRPPEQSRKSRNTKISKDIRKSLDWPLPKNLIDLEDCQCKYPLKTKWCGKKHNNKKPYCDKHMAVVYRKIPWKDMYKEVWQ